MGSFLSLLYQKNSSTNVYLCDLYLCDVICDFVSFGHSLNKQTNKGAPLHSGL